MQSNVGRVFPAPIAWVTNQGGEHPPLHPVLYLILKHHKHWAKFKRRERGGKAGAVTKRKRSTPSIFLGVDAAACEQAVDAHAAVCSRARRQGSYLPAVPTLS